ncbi:MAG: alpha/beta fold hydrolase [Kiloniellales bacterium]|nr:alpha/beta fold hydrolase [Kiloniellales bacterium]
MRALSAIFFGPLLLLVAACASTTNPPFETERLLVVDRDYDYPFVNPFAATVVGTPTGYKADLPEEQDVVTVRHDLTVFEGRSPPDVFWYDRALRFSIAKQEGPAPLVFVIAGTGGSDISPTSRLLTRILTAAGLHVISVPSPTNPNFIRNASTTGVPGRIGDDAKDLYRTMQLAYAEVKDEVEVTAFHLAGASLGAWQAPFVAQLDEAERAFGFGKVLLINPPVSLFNSIGLLDDLAEQNIPGGMANFSAFFDQVFQDFAEVYVELDAVDFSQDFLYRVYLRKEPEETDLAALVGVAFRLSANDMILTADVMSRFGFIVPRNRQLHATSSLTDFFILGREVGFRNYLDRFFYPYFRDREPGLTKEALIEEASFRAIEPYLRATDKIGLIHNEDDIILARGEIDYLRQVFGNRATIFPTGGHMGNLEHHTVVARIVRFFRD